MNDADDKKELPAGDVFNLMMEFAPLGMLIFDENFKILMVNQSFYKFDVIKNLEKIDGDFITNLKFESGISIAKELKDLTRGVPFEKKIKTTETLDGGQLSVIAKGGSFYKNSKFSGGIFIIEDNKFSGIGKNESLVKNSNFKYLMNNLAEMYLLTDIDGVIKYFPTKKELQRVVNFELNGELQNFFNDESKKQIIEVFNKVKTSEKAFATEVLINNGLQDRYFEINVIPYQEGKGEIKLALILMNDISDRFESRKNISNEIKELKYYQEITLRLLDAVINTDGNGNIVFWNEKAAELFKKSRSQVFGKFIGKIISGIDKKSFDNLKTEVIHNNLWEEDVNLNPEIEEEKIFHLKVSRVGIGSEMTLVFLCTDITARVKFEKLLRQSEERYRTIVTNSNEYICVLGNNGELLYANPSFTSVLGYSENELKKMKIADFVDFRYLKENKIGLISNFWQISSSLELPLKSKLGERIFVWANFKLSQKFSNQPGVFNAILSDISEKKKTEEDLKLIKTVFKASRDGIAILQGRKFILANESFAKMFGYMSADEVEGVDPLDIVSNNDIPYVAKIIQNYEKSDKIPEIFEFQGQKKDGTLFIVENSVTHYLTEHFSYLICVYRDITEQKLARVALKESEEKYRSISENINDCMWTAEREKGILRVVFLTQAIETMTGRKVNDFLKKPKLWFEVIHPNDLKKTLLKVKRLYLDKARSFDEVECRALNSNGNIVWVQTKIKVQRDAKGVVDKVFGLISDISVRKKAEQEIADSAEKLKTLNDTKDRFISIISHDLRTPFSSILGFTDILLADREMEEAKQVEYINFVQEASRNMLSLVNSLLDWTRLQTGRINFVPEKIEAKNIVNKAFNIVAGTALKKNITLESGITLPVFVHADENLLLQVLNNLVSNAIKFTQSGGKITVNASLIVDKRHVLFEVKDTGVGIKVEYIPNLFIVDKKFTLKGTEGEAGSGLGLSLCHDIIAKHGGDIWVESKVGKGSSFKFTIPISSTNILLIDDEKTDRILYSKLIKSLLPDYTIIEAASGQEALLEILHSQPSLIITDHGMPGMSGYELIKEIKLSHENYKPSFIVLSSDVNEGITETYRELGIEYVFSKPVNLNSFKFALDSSLKKALFTSQL